MKTQLRSADEELRLRAQSPTPNKVQHSPLPWSADKWATGYTISATDHSVCHLQDCNNEEANAKLIVRAVNHSDKLAEALRDLIGKIEEMHGCTEVNYAEGHEECYPEFDKARSEIAAYEEAQ